MMATLTELAWGIGTVIACLLAGFAIYKASQNTPRNP